MIILYKLLFCCFESVWRKSFGDDGFNLPIYKYRICQHLLNIAVIIAFLFYVREFSILESVYIALVIQLIYYSKSFYVAFDLGRAYPPTEQMLKDYKTFFNCVVEYIVPKEMWYKFGYDYIWLSIRYSYPLLLLIPLYNLGIVVLGCLVAFIYALGWSLNEKGKIKMGGIGFSEYIFGFVTGLFLAFC